MKPYLFFSTFRSSMLILFLLATFGNPSAFAEPTASELNNIGLIHEKLGNLDKAYAFYCRALNTDTDFTPAYAGLGDVYLAREEYRKAVEAYQNFFIIDIFYQRSQPNIYHRAVNTGNNYPTARSSQFRTNPKKFEFIRS